MIIFIAVEVQPFDVTPYEILEVPVETPVTIPVFEIVAIVGELLLHTPPEIELLSCIVSDSFTIESPVIKPTTGTLLDVILPVKVESY